MGEMFEGTEQLCLASDADWVEQRKHGIGASEIGSIVGVNPWSTALDVYMAKRGLTVEENEAMWWGTKLEPLVAERYVIDHNNGQPLEWYPVPMVYLRDRPHLRVTLDGVVRSDDDRKILEIKTTGRWGDQWGEPHTDQVPRHVLTQVQYQMGVTSADVCDVAAWCNRELRVYTIERNEELIESLFRAADQFWQRHLEDRAPEPDWGHKSTPELIKRQFGDDGSSVQLSDSAWSKWQEYEILGKELKDLQKQRETLRAQCLYEMGDAHVGTFAGGQELYKVHTKEAQVSYTRKASTQVRKRKTKGGAV